jgi:hypothetical protein
MDSLDAAGALHDFDPGFLTKDIVVRQSETSGNPRYCSLAQDFSMIAHFPFACASCMLHSIFAIMSDFTEFDREAFRNLLAEIGNMHMPFGKFGSKEYPPAGVPLIDLPVEYLVWFKERGFPKGRLGELMAQVCEIKEVGMDSVFDPLREARGGRYPLRAVRRRSFGFE